MKTQKRNSDHKAKTKVILQHQTTNTRNNSEQTTPTLLATAPSQVNTPTYQNTPEHTTTGRTASTAKGNIDPLC